MGIFDFFKNLFNHSERATNNEQIESTSKNVDSDSVSVSISIKETKAVGIVNEEREKRLKEHLRKQAKNTLELFSGVSEESKEKILGKFESVNLYMRITKQFELEMFSLFDGNEFVWKEYEYLKKWSERNGITTHWAERFCNKETPLNIIRLFIWTVINRAYDSKSKEELKEAGFKRSDLLVDYENDLKILKRFQRLKTLPWKHNVHPITPGLMCCRVCLLEDEKKPNFEVKLD